MGSAKNGVSIWRPKGAKLVHPPWDIYDTFPKCHNSNHNIHDLTMVLHWALHGPSNKDLSRFYKAMFIFSKKIHSLNPLNVMKHVNGHCCTLPRLREPSWTFLDTQMDPWMDPARLILGVQIDNCFKIYLQTTDKLKFTASFEVNQTFGSRKINTQFTTD